MDSNLKKAKIAKQKSAQINTDVENPAELRRIRFVDGLLDGKSMLQAAIDAGYSRVTARQASRDIMPRCREIFRQALQEKVGIGKLTDKIAEGMEAKDTRFFADKGVVTDERNVIDWSERRLYTELAADLMGFKPDRSGVNLNAVGNFQVAVIYGHADQDPDEDEPSGADPAGGQR